jgi:hypothetical protein
MPVDLKAYILKKKWTLLAMTFDIPLGLYSKIIVAFFILTFFG